MTSSGVSSRPFAGSARIVPDGRRAIPHRAAAGSRARRPGPGKGRTPLRERTGAGSPRVSTGVGRDQPPKGTVRVAPPSGPVRTRESAEPRALQMRRRTVPSSRSAKEPLAEDGPEPCV